MQTHNKGEVPEKALKKRKQFGNHCSKTRGPFKEKLVESILAVSVVSVLALIILATFMILDKIEDKNRSDTGKSYIGRI